MYIYKRLLTNTSKFELGIPCLLQKKKHEKKKTCLQTSLPEFNDTFIPQAIIRAPKLPPPWSMVEKKSSHLSWISGGKKPTESLTPSYTTEEKTSPAKGLKPWLWGKLARHTAAKTDPWSSEAPKTGANWREKSGKKKNKFPTTEVAFGHPSICEQHLDKLDNTPLNLPFSISIPWHAEKTASWTSPTGSRNGWFAATAAQAKWMPFALQHHDMTEVEIQLHFMWLKDSKLPSFPLTVSISTLRKFNIALAKKKSKNLHLQDTSKADVPHFPTCLNVFSQVSLRCIDKHNVGNAIPHSHLGCGWGLKAASTSHRSRTWVLYTLCANGVPKIGLISRRKKEGSLTAERSPGFTLFSEDPLTWIKWQTFTIVTVPT